MKIIPLNAPLGVSIENLSLHGPLNKEQALELCEIINKYQLVLFRKQELTASQQIAFSKALGPVRKRKLPADYFSPASSLETPGIVYVSNIRDRNGIPTGIIPDGEMWFHHDTCYTSEPDRFTMLYAMKVPRKGGNTLWANMYTAWKTLPDALKEQIIGKQALNVYDYATKSRPESKNLSLIEHAWHPAVIKHPFTGKKALFINRLMTCKLEGLSERKSLKVLEPIFDHAEQTCHIYEHHWKPGDFIIWDNLSTTHARTHFNNDDERRLRRSKVSGQTLNT